MTIQLDLESLTPWLWAAGVLLYLAAGVLVARLVGYLSGETECAHLGVAALFWPVAAFALILLGVIELLGWLAKGRERKG